MQKRQVFNPFLPLNEYIPDGEPHVFGDRVYIYGSHDKEGGYTFCMQDYVTYSAPVNDLSDWRYEGVIYKASQDSRYPNPQYLFAPDVVQGNDGKYYLYYCMGGDYGCKGYTGPIGVAVSDSPAGKFKFLGYVKNPDGTPMMKYVCFDPAAINDNGTIRIYYGTQYGYEEQDDFNENEKYINEEKTWNTFLDYIQEKEAHEIPHKLIYYLAHIPWHPDIWYSGNNISNNIKVLVLNKIYNYNKATVIKLLSIIGDNMICRGSIGQSIEAILSKVKNINSYLADIITEDSTSADIIKNASIILACYIGKKSLPLLKKAYEKKT